MLFQTLDDKEECVAIYADGKILQELPGELSRTWGYSAFLQDEPIEYAKIYCGGKTLDKVCPDYIKEDWDKINNRMKAYHRSFVEAKIDLRQNCFFDLVPERYLLMYYDLRNRITGHVFANYEKPANYDLILGMTKITNKIKYQNLNINLDGVTITPKLRDLLIKHDRSRAYINYNIYGTKTGRLATGPGSFPILTMKRDLRNIIKPTNDCFLELDFNAAELRTVLALNGHKQPCMDLHEWNVQNIYQGKGTRESAKKRVFAWLYNPNSEDKLTNRYYDRGKVKDRFFSNGKVKTSFNREIESDDYHAFNYIIQSTTSDLFMKQMIKIHDYLKDKQSFIAFSLHDSLVLDFSKEDLKNVPELVTMFSNTDLGQYLTNVSIGKNFGEMKKWKL